MFMGKSGSKIKHDRYGIKLLVLNTCPCTPFLVLLVFVIVINSMSVSKVTSFSNVHKSVCLKKLED